MDLNKLQLGLALDDVLLVPKFTTVESRTDVDLSVDLGKGIKLRNPIVSANMVDVTESAMARTLSDLGSLAILHRFCTITDQVEMFRQSIRYDGDLEQMVSTGNLNYVGAAVGVKDSDKERADKLIGAGCKIICVDVAHGDSVFCVKMTSWIAKNYPSILLIAGNVATNEGAERLHEAGADVIKCGIGPSSVCLTRINAAAGVPQLTALNDCFEASKYFDHSDMRTKRKFKIIADGGNKNAGDIVKSLCFADAVMLGNLLAGTEEAPGKIIEKNGVVYKTYAGSSTLKNKNIEGVKGAVALKGPVSKVVTHLLQGVSSGCSYQGVDNLEDLKRDPKFIRMTNSGLSESKAHSVVII